MQSRLNAFAAAPEAMQSLLALETYVRASGLETALIELVKTRASQINECAYCLEMHTRQAREAGDRGADLPPLRLARTLILYGARPRGAGLDRSVDAGGADPCAR